MINEDRQDQASLYVLRMLPPGEALAFARELERDEELQEFVRDLESTVSTVALAAPARKPPTSLRSRVIAVVRGETLESSTTSRGVLDWVPWTIAAGLALTAGTFWYEARTFRQGLAEAQKEVVELRTRDTLATTRIATLTSQVSAYEKALAVVVFDPQQQKGLVKLDHFPAPAAGKDYQLWVMDPAGGKPVSAGVIEPPKGGVVKAKFEPTRRMPSADTFAISVEPAGGSPEPRGEVILVGK
jgi:anti-sigma-K factor RskA